mmetsp:Transcript_25695/g.83006  ORF Transcript_25695/g.83006 Transcript_25695/m.83006 type:complete len:266 (-) Transcript_25695:456-1253(-)
MAVRRAWAQPALLTFLVAAVGWTMGTLELTQALMTTAGGRFETQSSARASAFLVAFGLSKAAGNFVAGWLADRAGRKPTMALGWAAGAAVPPLLYFARSWSVVVSTDIFLGLNQALCWATGIFALLDLLGPSRRALAVGLLEAAGYSAIAISRPVVTAVGGCSVEARERFRSCLRHARSPALVSLAATSFRVHCAAFGVLGWRPPRGKGDDDAQLALSAWVHADAFTGEEGKRRKKALRKNKIPRTRLFERWRPVSPLCRRWRST